MALLLRYQHLTPRGSRALVAWAPPSAPEPAQLPGVDVLRARGILPAFPVSREDRYVRDWFADVWRSVKQGVLRACCHGELADDWNRELAFAREVRREMKRHVDVPEHTTVEEQVVQGVCRVNSNEVKHVPRLVAQVVVALRMKLGLGAMDRSIPGNVAVVRAEAAKMMREWNLRTKDAAAHLLEVERCFFEDDTHYRVTTWRARACRQSRFLAWFLGNNPGVKFDY